MSALEEMLDHVMQEFMQNASKKLLQELILRQSEFVKNGLKLSFNEREAAEFLNMSPDALAVIRKAGGIGYSQTIAPPIGKNHGGRFIYLLSDLLDYAARNHVKPVGAEVVKLDDILTGKVVDIKSFKEAA